MVTLPVLRVFHCERYRIRTRDHYLNSLERYQWAITSPHPYNWYILEDCRRRLQLLHRPGAALAGSKALNYYPVGADYSWQVRCAGSSTTYGTCQCMIYLLFNDDCRRLGEDTSRKIYLALTSRDPDLFLARSWWVLLPGSRISSACDGTVKCAFVWRSESRRLCVWANSFPLWIVAIVNKSLCLNQPPILTSMWYSKICSWI